MLHDIWRIARYCNLRKFQCTIQNTSMVDPIFSDAAAYGDEYAVAVALMGVPLFFSETQSYDENARRQIRALLTAYHHLREMYPDVIVYPIGDAPNGASWTGFQSWDEGRGGGAVLVFRELYNKQPQATIRLHHIGDRKLQLRNVLSLETREITPNAKGDMTFTQDAAPSFIYYEYRVMK